MEEGNYYEPLEAFKAIGVSPNIKYTIHDDYTIMTMVEAGLGVSILAELILHRTNYKISLRATEPKISSTIAIGYKDIWIFPDHYSSLCPNCSLAFAIAKNNFCSNNSLGGIWVRYCPT